MRAVVIRKGEDSGWVVECPSLPGCVSQGQTKTEAIANIKEAIEGWIETMQAHGQPIPAEDFDTHVVAYEPLAHYARSSFWKSAGHAPERCSIPTPPRGGTRKHHGIQDRAPHRKARAFRRPSVER